MNKQLRLMFAVSSLMITGSVLPDGLTSQGLGLVKKAGSMALGGAGIAGSAVGGVALYGAKAGAERVGGMALEKASDLAKHVTPKTVMAASLIAAGAVAASYPGHARLKAVEASIHHPWNIHEILQGWNSAVWHATVLNQWRNNEFNSVAGSGLSQNKNREFYRDVIDTINNELQELAYAKQEITTSTKWYDKLALKGFFGPEKSLKAIELDARKKLNIDEQLKLENLNEQQFNSLNTEVVARIRNEVELLSVKMSPIRVHLAWLWVNNQNRANNDQNRNQSWKRWMAELSVRPFIAVANLIGRPSIAVSTEFAEVGTGIVKAAKKVATKWVWPFWWNFESEMEFLWELRKKKARLIKFKSIMTLAQTQNDPIEKPRPSAPVWEELPTYEQATGLPTYAQSMQEQHAPSAPALYPEPSAPAYDYPQYQYDVVPMHPSEFSYVQGDKEPIYC